MICLKMIMANLEYRKFIRKLGKNILRHKYLIYKTTKNIQHISSHNFDIQNYFLISADNPKEFALLTANDRIAGYCNF